MSWESLQLYSSERLHSGCGCTAPARFALGSTTRKYERSREFVVTHLALDLDILLDEKSIQGSASLDFSRRAPSAKALRLDGHGFAVERVELTLPEQSSRILGRDEYSYDGDEFIVPLTAETNSGRITITYRATPHLGLYFLSPDKQVPQRPKQVWSQCQDEDGKYWFPCQDKPHVKMTYAITARVPEGMTVLSGGQLLDKQNAAGGRWEYSYRLDEPTPAYLITLVVGRFDEWSETVRLQSGRSIELRYLVPEGSLEDGKRAFASTKRAVELFSSRTGVEYPFESYSQVVVADFIFGGMENTTATTMYEHILLDETACLDIESHDLVAHELAHHWFGDLVTCRDWSHAWLNEGFATYFEHVEREARTDRDEYEHHVTVDLNIYLGEARDSHQRAIVCRDYDEPIDLFDRHLYQKGGLVLHMLRQRLGDEAFFGAIRNYLTAHQGGIVETNDLMRAMEETSGLSLERFFDEWVYRPGHPSLKVSVSYSEGLLCVDVEQTQKGENVAVFELPFEIEVACGDERTVHRRTISERKSSIVVRMQRRPDWVMPDPAYLITAPISVVAPADMLRAQLKGGTTARARRLAALTLSKRQDPPTINALAASLANEQEAWMVRAKAAESLGKIAGEQSRAQLLKHSSTENPKVRRAIAEALGQLRGEEVEQALVQLADDKSYLVTAAAARSLGKVKSDTGAKLLRQLLGRDSWAEVVRAGAISALAEESSDEVTELLMEWTKYGKPLRARRAALSALGSIGEGLKVRKHLEEMLLDKDPHVRSAVLGALSALGDAKAKGAINELLSRELDGGVRTKARSVLGSLGKAGGAGLKELRDENQKLKQDLADLGTRLSKLEQVKSQAEPGASVSEKSAGPDVPPTASTAKQNKKAPAKKAPAKKAPPRRSK